MATRFDPFQEMDRMLSSLLSADRASATMPMDLYRSGDNYVLHIDLPGADPGTIDVNVEDRTLTIRAERSAPHRGGRPVAGPGASDRHVRQAAHGRPRAGARRHLRRLHRRRAHVEDPGGRGGQAAPHRGAALEIRSGSPCLLTVTTARPRLGAARRPVSIARPELSRCSRP